MVTEVPRTQWGCVHICLDQLPHTVIMTTPSGAPIWTIPQCPINSNMSRVSNSHPRPRGWQEDSVTRLSPPRGQELPQCRRWTQEMGSITWQHPNPNSGWVIHRQEWGTVLTLQRHVVTHLWMNRQNGETGLRPFSGEQGLQEVTLATCPCTPSWVTGTQDVLYSAPRRRV